MKRPRTYTIAAVVLAIYCAISLVFQISSLALGAGADAAGGPPFFVVVINFALAILGCVAVYGVWRVQKWAVVLAIAVGAMLILTSELPGMIFAPDLGLRLSSMVGLVLLATTIVLLLRPVGNVQRVSSEASLGAGQATTARVE
ncbi:MAG: hypothetical protein U0232_14900 [Thermomicrobiales bacterium]